VYLGRHHHESRSSQGYTVEDMVLQIRSGLAADAAPFLRGSMTSSWAIHARDDGYGKRVRDQAVFELMARKPRFELYSVIPKSDEGETVRRIAVEKETPGQGPGVEAGPCGPAGVALTAYPIRTSPTKS
jgi:hypothetical protein